MGFIKVVLFLAGFYGVFSIISIGLYCILKAIRNQTAKKFVFATFCIFLLPFMLYLWSVGKITETEKLLGPFSYSLLSRSRIVLIATVVYAFIYYALYQILFK